MAPHLNRSSGTFFLLLAMLLNSLADNVNEAVLYHGELR